jgi:tRNA (adenine22-N1)-methyltransferase
MELSLRLQAVADMVTDGRSVADIGCDHGYVSIYLYQQKQCPKVIAMDVKNGPLERAKANIEKYGLNDYIEVRLSDGASALQEGEVDTLLLAGMGGRLIIRILEQGFAHLGTDFELVLQPQSEIFLVRAFLRQQGMEITDEQMVLDEGKYYAVIKAQPAEKAKTENQKKQEAWKNPENRKGRTYRRIVEDYFGPVLLQKHPAVFEAFLKKEWEKTKWLLTQVTGQERLDELTEYLSYVEEAMQESSKCPAAGTEGEDKL